MINYVRAVTDADYESAGELFKAYAAWLNIDLGFQHFSDELQQLKKMYALPVGGIILCKVDGQDVGCVGIRKLEAGIAELKRMYVQPAFQQKGIGKELLNEAIKLAIECGYRKIRLDTLSDMHPAINLYTRHGFYEIPAYYYNPEPTAVYFEKLL
jgi:ribosomal protein S18 acetylase RimI-like enzyme